MRSLESETVLRVAASCVVRSQIDQVLMYNRLTDEMHLIPHGGYRAVELCDGFTSIGEIEGHLAAATTIGLEHIRDRLRAFFAALIERGLLDFADD